MVQLQFNPKAPVPTRVVAPLSLPEPSAPLLEVSHQNCTRRYCVYCRRREAKFRRRKGRTFQRAMSGLKVGKTWQLWTLTTSDAQHETGKSIQQSFRALVMRMRRAGLCQGYMKVIEYTKRGRAHIHMLLQGPPVPWWWMNENWQAVHSSFVWYSQKRQAGKGKGAGYLAKYMGKDPRARYSWSWDWVWKGFAKDWKVLVCDGLDGGLAMLDIIALWDAILEEYGHSGRAKIV